MRASLDFRGWRPRPLVILAAAGVLAYVVALAMHGGLVLVAAGLLLADLIVQMLPWRLPRSSRTGLSLWLEATCCLAGLTAWSIIALASDAQGFRLVPHWQWFAVAIVAGLGLAAWGGMNFRLLLGGDLAFALGPVKRPHAWARATTAAIAPVGEEAAFRGVILGLSPASVVPLALLSSVGFVARHYVPHGVAARGSVRNISAEVLAAGLFLTMTLATGSILPALVAHLTNNLPRVILEIQRSSEVIHA